MKPDGVRLRGEAGDEARGTSRISNAPVGEPVRIPDCRERAYHGLLQRGASVHHRATEQIIGEQEEIVVPERVEADFHLRLDEHPDVAGTQAGLVIASADHIGQAGVECVTGGGVQSLAELAELVQAGPPPTGGAPTSAGRPGTPRRCARARRSHQKWCGRSRDDPVRKNVPVTPASCKIGVVTSTWHRQVVVERQGNRKRPPRRRAATAERSSPARTTR